MSRDVLGDWIMIAGGAWMIQYFSRIVWAMVVGGPDAGKFFRNGNKFRENRGRDYWAILTIVGGLLILIVVTWALTAAKLAGCWLPDSPTLVGFAAFALCSLFAIASGWTVWASFDEWRRTITGWISIGLIAAVFLAMIAGCLLSAALAFGFVE